jgi:hypothetical protein
MGTFIKLLFENQLCLNGNMPNKNFEINSKKKKKKLNPLRFFDANAQIRFNFLKHPQSVIQAHRIEIPSLGIG